MHNKDIAGITVPKDTEGELIWEWDWQRNQSVEVRGKRVASSGPKTQGNGG